MSWAVSSDFDVRLPQPKSASVATGFARLEEWLASVLKEEKEQRLLKLCEAVRARNVRRPFALATASDDLLTECGFSEEEKRRLREARAAALERSSRRLVWHESDDPIRLTEIIIVCSTIKVLQIGLRWVSPKRTSEKWFPETSFCGEIKISKLVLGSREYVTEIAAKYEVLPAAQRTWTSTTASEAYRCLCVYLKTNKRFKTFKAGAYGSYSNERTYGRRPLPQILLRDRQASKQEALVGLTVIGHASDITALGGVWAKRIKGPTKISHHRPAEPPSFAPSMNTSSDRNAYTGSRISRFDPWFRDDPDDRPIAVAKEYSELPAVSLVPVGDALVVPTPTGAKSPQQHFNGPVVAEPMMVEEQQSNNDACIADCEWPIAPSTLPSPLRPLRRHHEARSLVVVDG